MPRLPSPTARQISRVLIALGVVLALLTVFFAFASWTYDDGTTTLSFGFFAAWPIGHGPGPDLATIARAIVIGTAWFGVAWMVRIYRTEPEAGPSPWRSQHRD
jgi:hypothetical protein